MAEEAGKRLKTAVIGLDGGGNELIDAVARNEQYQLIAVGDRDANLVEKAAGQYGCSGYDDLRQLIIGNKFDCVVVGGGLYSCEEYVRGAMKRGFNVLKLAPAARNFEEAAELVRLAGEAGVNFAVINEARFSSSFRDFGKELEANRPEGIFLINAVCFLAGGGNLSWQNDRQLSGGGVLLRGSYEIVDQVVLNFGMPEQVYCLCTNSAADRQQRVYLAEETAVVTMRFNDVLSGNLVASRQQGIGGEDAYLEVHGREKILKAGFTEFVTSDSEGKQLKRHRYKRDRGVCFSQQLDNFARRILWPEQEELISSAWGQLTTMAVIDAAYLSSRTGMPEEPARVMQMGSGEPTFAWPSH